MTTKNLSKSFKSKINGQRLPPIPITDEQPSVPIGELPPSILKKTTHLPNEVLADDHGNLQEEDDDELESARTFFQKSRADVLLLLDTYPPKTWTVPQCLKSNYDNQGRASKPIFDTLFPSNDHQADLIDTFPAPLSDRIPSSRYCRRSVSSACSRRSSILYPRHTNSIPVDSTQFLREDTFDTICENLRSSYTPLPPIPTDPKPNLSTSLTIPSVDPPPSISPPLITADEAPDIQEKKDEFTRHLLSKSLRREPTVLPVDKTMNSPSIVHKTAAIKPDLTPRLQKSMAESRRVNSVERHVPVAAVRIKLPTATSSTSINTSHQRLGKVSMDIFQPQSKSIAVSPVTNKKSLTTNNKIKVAAKINPPKVKVAPPISNEEVVDKKNDVIPSPSVATIETSEVVNIVQTETLPSPTVNVEPVSPQIEQSKLNVPTRSKRHASSGNSARYAQRCSQSVPKPLTLQGEKPIDTDYSQTTSRTASSGLTHRQRRGSLKDQPVITTLFEEPVVEAQSPLIKSEPTPATNSCTARMKKPRTSFLKSAKPKKTAVIPKPKSSTATVGKTETKSQSTNTETNEQKQTSDNGIVIGGTDWIMTVKPQLMNDEESVLSNLFEALTVDDEDIPVCNSPIDPLASSQVTLMTSFADVVRRNSIESVQAVEISPVLTQIIGQPIEQNSQLSKPNESSLINSDIRTVYETVKDSIRKDSSFRSLTTQSNDQEVPSMKPSLTATLSSPTRTLPFEPSDSVVHTYTTSDTGLSIRPALRVVNDSLNSRGSETLDSTSSHEDYNPTPLCTETDCDEVCRTAKKGRQVGKGAYGIVWSYFTITGVVIAVKEIELDEGDSERVRNDYESVREEIHILRGLNHPYIVKFLGISLENSRLAKIFMEHLPNGTIEYLITSFGPFHNDVLKKYTQQIVQGVAYLHENGVVHRDIKGKNVMLDVVGNIKLIDFGCAKRLKNYQNTHSMRQILKSMKGTANWMAPEIIAETGHGKKADIWSIGCTLCEMATGKPPWSSEHNHLAVLLIIANGTKPPADLPDTCPVTAQEFFRLCLTRDPVARPSAKDLLNHPFLNP